MYPELFVPFLDIVRVLIIVLEHDVVICSERKLFTREEDYMLSYLLVDDESSKYYRTVCVTSFY